MDWDATQIPDTLTVEVDGKPTPLREHPFMKEPPDIATFAKRSFDLHREVNARVPVRADTPEAREAWTKEHLPKLYKAGLIEPPPDTPDGYGIKKPDDLYEGFNWSDDRAKKFAETMHKYRVPKAAADEILALHREALVGTSQALKTSFDSGMSALRAEFGADFDRAMEDSKRLTKLIFKSPEEVQFFDETGASDHPLFLGVMMRLAKFAQQDSSLVDSMRSVDGGGSMTREEVRALVSDIMSNPDNPRNKGYWRKDPDVMKWIQEQYAKIEGADQKVTF